MNFTTVDNYIKVSKHIIVLVYKDFRRCIYIFKHKRAGAAL
jgi:hypothetical protein